MFWERSEPGQSGREQKREFSEGKKVYQTEAGPVELTWRKFTPSRAETDSRERLTQSVVFLPGWMMEADSETIVPLSQSFADYAMGPTYAVSTRAENRQGADVLMGEARAVRQFIEEEGISEIVISGHSQGGDKAIDLTDLIQERDPQIAVKGVILIDSAGLYGQEKGNLVSNFLKDSVVSTFRGAIKSLASQRPFLRPSFQAGTDFLFGLQKEIKQFKTKYPKRLSEEINEMAKFNKRAENITVPVILVHGATDEVFSPEQIAPVEPPSEREKYLKKNLFKSSPYVRMVIAEKASHHGLPLFRPESVARASLYMLERFYRNKKK